MIPNQGNIMLPWMSPSRRINLIFHPSIDDDKSLDYSSYPAMDTFVFLVKNTRLHLQLRRLENRFKKWTHMDRYKEFKKKENKGKRVNM